MQVALLLLLLVCLYLMSLFASGSRHAARAIEYSRATVLAQRRMEEARHFPLADLTPGTRAESEPYTGFNTTLDVRPFEGSLFQLQITCTAPSGARAQACTLCADPSGFQGVATDSFTHQVAWVSGANLMAWDDVTRTATNLGAPGDGRLVGGLAGHPGSNALWRGGRGEGPAQFLESLPTPRTWGAPLSAPASTATSLLSLSRMAGLVADGASQTLLVADVANRALWHHDGGSWNGPLRPQNPPLGRPAGLAADPWLSVVWVADYDYQCLRKLLSPQAAANYPAAQLEPAGAIGSWHRTRFRPPAALGFGGPVGLGMDPQGWGVLVHDGSRLYRFAEGNGGWQVLGTMPAALIAEGPQGLTCDRFAGRVYLSTMQGGLWKAPAGPVSPSDFQKLSP